MPTVIHTKAYKWGTSQFVPLRPEPDTLWHSKGPGTDEATNREKCRVAYEKNSKGTMGSVNGVGTQCPHTEQSRSVIHTFSITLWVHFLLMWSHQSQGQHFFKHILNNNFDIKTYTLRFAFKWILGGRKEKKEATKTFFIMLVCAHESEIFRRQMF